MTAAPASLRKRCWNAPLVKLDTADSDEKRRRQGAETENASIVNAPIAKLALREHVKLERLR